MKRKSPVIDVFSFDSVNSIRFEKNVFFNIFSFCPVEVAVKNCLQCSQSLQILDSRLEQPLVKLESPEFDMLD